MLLRATAMLVFCMACLSQLYGAEYLWRASWGVFPDKLDSSVTLVNTNTIAPINPVLTSTDMILQTPAQYDGVSDNFMAYVFNSVQMPTQLVIEAEVQCVSGYSAKAGRPYLAILFTTGSNIGGLLGIEAGDIYLLLDDTHRQVTATANTDDTNHLYRIEVDSTSTVGSPIRVYQDGVLAMTGSVASNGSPPNWDAQPIIWFGDGTSWAYGTSRWRSFRHNAATIPSKPVLFIGNTPEKLWWPSHSNVLYNVQQCSDLRSGVWLNAFTNIVGTGGTNLIFDTGLRTNQSGFYRVQSGN